MIGIGEQDEQFYYFFDLDKIVEFVFKQKENNDESNEQDETTDSYEKIEHVYDANNDLQNTVITTELNNPKMIDIKYDLLKGLISEILEPSAEGDQNSGFTYVKDPENASMGFKIALNTLLNYEMIKNKE